jgi:hypothetical protein
MAKLTRRALLGAGFAGAALAITRSATAGTQTARFEVLHASPDAPNVDLYVENVPIQSGLSYTQFSKRFVIATGSYQIRVFPTGADPNGAPALVIPIGLEPNQRFLLAITNRLPSLEGAAYLEPAAPPAGQALIRLINLDPGSPALDLVDVGTGAILIPEVGFKAGKNAMVPQATLTLQLRQSGTANVVMAIAPSNFPGGTVSTVIKFAPDATVRARSVGETQPNQLIIRRRR